MSRFRRPAAAIVAVVTFWPTLVFGQASKAGVVTTLEGNVTVTRVALPQPQPLKFKDDVFVNDKVTTGDKAIARMLLGGKAVVTVRERSSLTITEVPGKSTIDLDVGKIALAVAKDKMKPGELIEIRTQNAIAGVRGTVVVAEVSRATAQVGGPAPAVVTSFYVLRGQIFGQQINAATGALIGAPVQVSTLQQFRASGISPSAVTNIPPAQVAQIVSGLSTTIKASPTAAADASAQANENAFGATVALANAITGGGGDQAITGGGLTLDQPPPPRPSGCPPFCTVPTSTTTPTGLTNAFVTIDRNVTLPDAAAAAQLNLPVLAQDNLATISGTVNWGNLTPVAPAPPENGPYGRIIGVIVNQASGNTTPMLDVQGTLNLLSGNGLLEVINSTVNGNGPLVNVAGTITQSAAPPGGTTAPLILIDPSTVTPVCCNDVVSIDGTLNLSGPLLRSVSSTLTSDFNIVEINGDVTSTTTDPLIDLSGGSVSYGASGGSLLTVNGGSITTSGGLVRASGVMFVPTSGQPLINVVGGSVTVGGPLFELSGTLNLGSGPLADPVVFSDGGDFGADITVTAGAAFRVTSGTLTAKSLYASAGNGESLTINGPFLEITGGAVHLSRLVDPSSWPDIVANLPANTPFVRLTGGSLTTTLVDEPLIRASAENQTGTAFSAGAGTTTTLKGPLLSLEGVSGLDTNPLVQLTGATLNTSGSSRSIITTDGDTLSTASGPLLRMIGGTLTSGDAVLGVPGGDLTVNNATTAGLGGAVLQFSGGAVVNTAAEVAFVEHFYSLTLDRGLIDAVNTTFHANTNSEETFPFVMVWAGSALYATTSAPLINLDASTVTTGNENSGLLGVGEGGPASSILSVTGGGAVIRLANMATGSLSGISSPYLVNINDAAVTIEGPLYDIVNSGTQAAPLNLGSKTLLYVQNGSVINTGPSPVFNLSNSVVTVDRLVLGDGFGNTYNLGGPALQMTNSTLIANRLGGPDPDGSTDVTNFATVPGLTNIPFARLTNSTLTVTGAEHDLFGLGDDLVDGGQTTYGVSVIATDSTINLHGSLARFEQLTSNATDPMVQLTRVTVNQTGADEDRALMAVDSLYGVTFAGPMARIDSSTLNLSRSLFYVEEGTTTFNGAALPVIDILNSTITTPEDIVGVGSETSLATAGALLRVNQSTLNARSIFRMDGGTTATLGGTLLNAIGSVASRAIFNAAGDFVRIGDGSVFTSTTSNPVIVSTLSTFNVGLSPLQHEHFFLVNGAGGSLGTSPAQAFVAGPLLNSSHDGFNIAAGFLETSNGGAATSPILFKRTVPTTAPLMTFLDSVVTLGISGGSSGNFIDIRSNGAVVSNGPIASVTGSVSTGSWTLDRLMIVQCFISCGTTAATPGFTGSASTTDSLFTFNGGFSGSHTINTAMFELAGTTLAALQDPDPDAPATVLGADQPVRHAGTFFTGNNTNINSHGPAFKLDTMLLIASAPVIALTNSNVSLGTSASTPHGIDLANKAKMTVTLGVPGDAMVMLNNSALTIANGHGTNVGGGSFLKVLGDFLRMANGSTLTISNGSALNVAGGSSVSISGAFVNFVGTGNVINLTNSLCATLSCSVFNGVRVAFANGALPANVSIGVNAIKNPAGGVINPSATAAGILLDGAASKVRIVGP